MVEPRGDGDFPQEPLGAEHGGQLGPQHLEGDGPVVLQIVGKIDRGHAAPTELALDPVATGQRRGEAGRGAAHGEGDARSVANSCASFGPMPDASCLKKTNASCHPFPSVCTDSAHCSRSLCS